MSREIKFRAWDKTAKRMIQLGENQHDTFWFDGGVARYTNLQNGSGGDEYELMQYTGLKDKHGREIYEGDIIRFQNTYMESMSVIKWHADSARWSIDSRYLDVQEVIGNIYENPELIDSK